MTQHTPGPWIVTGNPPFSLPSVYSADMETCISDRIFNGNARLIAAAPDLLAALRKIHANAAESADWIRQVTAEAIAKATAEHS